MQFEEIFAWIILPILIFCSRIIDVSLGTLRVIFVSKGLKYWATTLGFFEVLIWLIAIGQIMTNLSNPVSYIAYAGGFAMGNFVGIHIAEKLSLGMVMLRIVTRESSDNLINSLFKSDFGVTTVEGHGRSGKVRIIFTIVPKRKINQLIRLVNSHNPRAFYTIEEVNSVQKGIQPVSKPFIDLKGITRPFRKSK